MVNRNSLINKDFFKSNIFYKHLAQLNPEAILIHSEGKILYANPATLKLMRAKKPEEIIGQSVKKFIHPDTIPFINKRIKNFLSKNKIGPFAEEKFINLKGEIIIAETKAVPFMFNGKSAILAILRDITERKNLEERQKFLEKISTLLGESLDYKTTLQNICHLLVPYFADYIRIVLIDDKKNIEDVAAYHVNPKKLNLVKNLYKKYKNRSDASHGVDKILTTGKAEIMEHAGPSDAKKMQNKKEIQDILSALKLTSYMGVPLKLSNRIIGVITFSSIKKDRIYKNNDLEFAKEIARRIAYTIENARLYTQAQDAISLRDEFISLVSHELKTPLTSLKIYAQSLGKQFDRKGDTTVKKYFEKMDEQTNKLLFLVNDLLNVSKIEHGKLEFNIQKIDLNLIVKETAAALQETTSKHKINIIGSIKSNVLGDAYRIYQVLTNLLTNAIKYSPNANKINIYLTSKSKFAKVTVQDFGIGIEKKYQGKIFSQFYRVNNTEVKTFPGLGMGLFISNEIIKRHGGTMEVKSIKGKESNFSFTLPFLKF